MVFRLPGAGQLRDKVTIERPERTPNGRGGEVVTWTAVASGASARISPTKGGEDVRAARLTGVNTYDVTVRFTTALSAIEADWRVTNDRTGDEYNVVWASNLEQRRRFLTITVKTSG